MPAFLPTTLPFTDALPVTPSDGADLTNGQARGLLVAVGGTLQVTTGTGQTRALTVPAGRLDLIVTRVWSTNTTATGISALY